MPEYRKSYVEYSLEKWIESAKKAEYDLKENINYIIKDNDINIVDYDNTGVI